MLQKFHVQRRRFWVVEVKHSANRHVAEVHQTFLMHQNNLKQ
jgi:hypothetical protein